MEPRASPNDYELFHDDLSTEVKYKLRRWLDFSRGERTPKGYRNALEVAAHLGDTAMVKKLLATGQGSQEKPRYGYPLLLATHSGCVETVEFLLTKGADLAASIKRTEIEETPLDIAWGQEDPQMLMTLADHLMRHEYNSTTEVHKALGKCAEQNDEYRVKNLLANGADPNFQTNGFSPALVSAANGGSVAISSILLKERAIVDLRCDTSGCAALEVAAGNGNTELLELLLESGANLNGHNDGGPLIAAAKYGKLQAVKALVEKGACVDIANSKRETPIGVAASLDEKDVFEYLKPLADFGFALKSAFDEGYFYSQNQQHVGRVHSYTGTEHWHQLWQCNLAVLKYKSGSAMTDISTSWAFIFVLCFLSQLI
ncbi:uncharacterized protein N7446_010784 [Penicillium canescens]|uniref:Uncharacterized protein n=1 Tax=Penicillium canescens TaxID=5083 RepID=A0AAD6N8A6_PENCN|nr:uncharacterized protein N7446_010784 [Penicillium canescens]KAJ6041323.1 hypothetical protein N7460_006713 [Penicillium canescens]KAJ6050675.1 hypothetical protein N7446_010784 [Penicillium canescens]KAJ6065898.1 hypothetical protein N7444_001551 [Penicillium canescens]